MAFLLDWWPAFLIAAELALQLAIVVRVIQRGPRRSASALAWIIVIIALPVAGIVGWFLVGEARLGQRRRERHAQLAREIQQALPASEEISERPETPSAYRFTITLTEAVGGTPPRAGNRLRLMGDTDRVIDLLIGDIDAARGHCHLLFYIWIDDRVGRRLAEALMRAAGRGIACRVLVDDVGSRPFLRSGTCRGLRAAGVQVVRALPVNLLRRPLARVDVRNHRKLAVIDGCIGYTGSQNVAEASFASKPRFAPWVDCMLRVEGPVVADLQRIFVCDWFLDTGEKLQDLLTCDVSATEDGVLVQVLPTGPSQDNEALEQLALAALQRARRELILTTPYFVPGELDAASICTAARRGVEVKIVLPGRNDSWLVGAVSRSHYLDLMQAGVRVYEFQKGLLHAKTMTVDGDLALITTANFDQRSFDLNFEVSTLVYDAAFATQLRSLQHTYIEDSVLVDAARMAERGWLPRLVDNAAGVFSPLL